MVARFERLDAGAYDVVLCTQPASWAVRHPRKVVLFYHHTRTFYDLFEAIEGVRGHDVALHHLAAFIVRDVDGIGFVYFDEKDVVRHKLVQQIVKAYEKWTNGAGATRA